MEQFFSTTVRSLRYRRGRKLNNRSSDKPQYCIPNTNTNAVISQNKRDGHHRKGQHAPKNDHFLADISQPPSLPSDNFQVILVGIEKCIIPSPTKFSRRDLPAPPRSRPSPSPAIGKPDGDDALLTTGDRLRGLVVA